MSELSTPIDVTVMSPESPLSVVMKENNLELESAEFLVKSFEPLLKRANDWAAKVATINVTDITQTREMKLARETRLALREVRINTEKVRKSLTEDNVRRNRAINGAANIIKFLVEPLEEKLEAQEKFVELQEKKRKDELKQTRLMLLAPFGTDTSFYNLDEMTENVFQQLLAGETASHEKKKSDAQRIETERLAEENRKALEQEKVRLENEKLKAEAQAREAAAQIERQKAAEALKAAQEAAKKEKEIAESKAATALAEERRKAQEQAARLAELQKKEKEEAAKKLEAEKKAREAAEAAKKKAEAEAKAVADAAKKLGEKLAAERLAEENAKKEAALREKELQEAAIKKAASAPDREKLATLAKKVRELTISLNDAPIQLEIYSQIEKFALWIEKKANSL